MGSDSRRDGTSEMQDIGISMDAFEDEDAALRLLRDADAILRSRVTAVLPDFVTQVFADAAPEDLVHYQASEIAEIAERAWLFLGERQSQAPRIRLDAPHSTSGRRLNSVSIVEILNDDMPFLVDSVMAELTEQGYAAHLVLHPRFFVERDASGTLIALATSPPSGGAPRRESLI